jgi:hypothetical protein
MHMINGRPNKMQVLRRPGLRSRARNLSAEAPVHPLPAIFQDV